MENLWFMELREEMIPDYIIKCKLCGKREITAWHPFWGTKQICWFHRELIVKRHKKWLDKIGKPLEDIINQLIRYLKDRRK